MRSVRQGAVILADNVIRKGCVSLAACQWLELAGFVLLVPLTGEFLIFDSRLVRRWRTEIVEMAQLRSLDRFLAIIEVLNGRGYEYRWNVI
jgi:hypothetical protein